MLRILIVDDSLIIRKKISKLFEKLGHKVVSSATNGQEAIREYERHKPDLLTMDITMPDMDGITAVKHIIGKDAEAKIMMVTSHGQEDKVMDSIQAGAVGYLLKPITEDNLTASIEKIKKYIKKENKC